MIRSEFLWLAALDDWFTAANLSSALARPAQKRAFMADRFRDPDLEIAITAASPKFQPQLQLQDQEVAWHPLVMSAADRLKSWAKKIKRDAVTLWFACKHPSTPWYAKALGVFVVAYALTPIDLIPDFIPVLGYLDDVLLLPGLIWVAIRLLPPDVLANCRSQAGMWMKTQGKKPSSRIGAVGIVMLWIAVSVALLSWLLQPG